MTLLNMTAILIFWAYGLRTENNWKEEQNMTNQPPCPSSHRQNITLEQTAAYAKPTKTSCMEMTLTTQEAHKSNLSPLFYNLTTIQ